MPTSWRTRIRTSRDGRDSSTSTTSRKDNLTTKTFRQATKIGTIILSWKDKTVGPTSRMLTTKTSRRNNRRIQRFSTRNLKTVEIRIILEVVRRRVCLPVVHRSLLLWVLTYGSTLESRIRCKRLRRSLVKILSSKRTVASFCQRSKILVSKRMLKFSILPTTCQGRPQLKPNLKEKMANQYILISWTSSTASSWVPKRSSQEIPRKRRATSAWASNHSNSRNPQAPIREDLSNSLLESVLHQLPQAAHSTTSRNRLNQYLT